MKEFKLLKLLDIFKYIFKIFNINYPVMRKIIRLKLIMDSRKTPAVFNNTGSNKKEGGFLRSYLIIYGFYGLFLLVFFFIPISMFGKMSFVMGMILFLAITTMISEFSNNLLNLKDKNILLSRPIDASSVNAAKIVHIFMYLTIITLALSIPSIIAGAVIYGVVFPLIFLIQIFFLVIFVIFLTSFLYGFILRFFDGEKLKDIITYLQIGISIAIPIGYQFIGEMFEIFEQEIIFTPEWWTYLLPPAWFAGIFELLVEQNFTINYLVLSILALVIPILGMFTYVKVISPYFEHNLSKMDIVSKKESGFRLQKEKITKKIISFFCFNYQENAFIRFVKNMLSQERKLKLTIYPSLVFAFIFPFIMLKNNINFNDLKGSLIELSRGNSYFWLYFGIILLSNVVSLAAYSEFYKGAWIYKMLPVEDYSIIKKAKIKGLLFKYIIPVFILISILYSFLFGIRIIGDLFIMGLNMIFILLLVARQYKKQLPFTKKLGAQSNQTRQMMSIFIFMVVGAISAGIHYFAKQFHYYSLILYFIILIIINMIIWKRTFRPEKPL